MLDPHLDVAFLDGVEQSGLHCRLICPLVFWVTVNSFKSAAGVLPTFPFYSSKLLMTKGLS